MSASMSPGCPTEGRAACIPFKKGHRAPGTGWDSDGPGYLECPQRHRGRPDLWGYMSFGRLFWETGRFPHH